MVLDKCEIVCYHTDMNKQIDLAKQADEAELAFMQAARVATTEAHDERVKQLCGEYLNVLKLKRLKEE